MNILFEKLEPTQIYHLMIQLIVPRPIAWVLSENPESGYNLAPFSYFNGVCSNPPMVMISIGHKGNGEKKDTWRNIERNGEFVIHIPSTEDAKSVTDSAFEFEYGESELQQLGLETQPRFSSTQLPALSQSKVALYCKWYETKELGPNKQGLVFGEIVEAYVEDHVAKPQGRRIQVDAGTLNPLARLGGSDYAGLTESITVPKAKTKPGSQ